MPETSNNVVCVKTDKGDFLVSNLKPDSAPVPPPQKKKIMYLVKDGVRIQVKTKPKIEPTENKPIFKLPERSISPPDTHTEQQKQKAESSGGKTVFNLPESPSTSASVNITSSKPIDLKTILSNCPTPKIGKFSFTFNKMQEVSPSTSKQITVSEKPRRATKRPARYSDDASAEVGEQEKPSTLVNALAKIQPMDTEKPPTLVDALAKISPMDTPLDNKCGCIRVIPEVVNQIQRIASRLDVLTRIMQAANRSNEIFQLNEDLKKLQNENKRLKQQIEQSEK